MKEVLEKLEGLIIDTELLIEDDINWSDDHDSIKAHMDALEFVQHYLLTLKNTQNEHQIQQR